MSFCQSCGANLASDTRFCQSCGSSTTEPMAVVSVPAAENSSPTVAFPAPANTGSKAMDTNLVGALAYLAGFITGIIFLVLDPYKSNSFVRFHAFQCIFLCLGWIALGIGLSIFGMIPVIGWATLLLWPLIGLAGLVLWIMLFIKAYQGQMFKVPFIGDLAMKQAGA